MKSGIELIAEERQRQVDVEGWDYKHDADYDIMQLSAAAGCYLANAQNKWMFDNTETDKEVTTRFQILDEDWRRNKWVDAWPWDKEWDKRKKHDALRSLVIAGALIAAEIDRLQK